MVNRGIGLRLRSSHMVAELFDCRIPYFKGSHKVRNMLTRLIAPKPHVPCDVPTRYGFEITVTSDNDNIDQNLYYGGTYEAGTLQIIASCLRSRDNFVDVGANIGVMSLLASRHVGSEGAVYAFEPVPQTFEMLEHNIELNQVNNIYGYNVGLGKNEGSAIIYNNRENNRGTASFLRGNSAANEIAEVPINSLDKFVAEYGLDNIRLLKMDVEGWELEVLKGATKLLRGPDAPIICVEYNTTYSKHEDVYRFVSSINSYQVHIPKHGRERISRLIQVENLSDLPREGDPNLYCFLPDHLNSVPSNIFV